ncbi:little elongation complex subunit 1 isoform X1 [Onychostruthus taczanowskii]|uniref:little elongation complex subunit 1 isoform X1 n=1 Tax=Onychostruthus taczanowskii TaxID=356909 RepID=UPI001B80BA98|nr:little elongation complex subunit 1 isoform X1 [Onychostruthus taczanowskii]
MMPGETPLPPAGTAAAGRACANCGVLQQNMNDYVAALIALKQKIIDGDRLLTEYQQKCTELQFAEREISALRCQVEKMLQKILPLEKCQEELGSLKAELEEKKSSLKIYQESQLEYDKIKEEILNSDAVRKKLETKVKKLEEAATKHTQDFRQLKTEKKRLEKELKKAQGKLDGVIKEKCRKLKHAETQSSSEDLATDIDKGRVKLLLEELWMCIDSASGKRENEKNDPVLDTVQIQQKIKKCDGKTLPWCSSGESAVKQNSVTAMIIQRSTEPFGDDCAVNRTAEEQLHSGEDKNVDVIIQTGREHSTSGFSTQEQRDPGGNVMDILNWARPLPALLSPVQLSPLTTQDMFLGEVTGSSDEEDDCSTSAVEGISQEDKVQPPSCNVVYPGDECNRQCKSCEHGFDEEISLNLSWNEKNIHISPKISSKERDAERKQGEGAILMTNMVTNKNCLEENSGDVGTENRELTGATAQKSEDIEEQKGDGEDMDSEEGDSSVDFMLQSFKPQNQTGKCSVIEQTEENVTLSRAVDNEGTHEKCGELVNAERDKLVAQRETSREASVLQSVTHLLSKQCIVLHREDAEEKSDVLIENEVVENKSKNVVILTNMAEAIEISAHSQCSEIKHDSEEILEKQHMQTKDKVNRECEPETVKVSRHYLPVSATEGIRTLSVFPNDEQLKIEDVNITRAPSPELTMKFNRGSVLEVAELSELLHSAENVKLVDIKEVVGLRSKPHHEKDGSNLSQRKSNLENILELPKTACIIGVESSVAKCESSVLDFTEVKGEIKQSENLCEKLECGQSKSQNFRLFESLECEVSVNPEDCGGESSELLARGDTIKSILIESNPMSQEQFAKPLIQLLISENIKCDEIEGKLNKQSKELVTETCSSSLKQEKNVVKKNNTSEIICQPTSEIECRSGLAFSTQKDLEKCCINNEETNSPVQVEIGLESTRSPDLNISLQKVVAFLETNLAGKAAFSYTWENKGHTNSIMSSTFNSSSDNLEEGAEFLTTEKVNMGKELGCPEREYVHKNEEKTSDKEQPVDKEPQAPVKSQVMYANPYKNAFLLQKFHCQESGCRTSTWKVRTDPSRTNPLTGGEESKELNGFVGSGRNAIIKCKSDFDMPEQSNDSEEKDCSLQKVKCSECVPMFRNKLRSSSRIALDALETGAVVDADYQVCELHSMRHPGNTFTVSHLKADTVLDMNTHCEPNNSGGTANEWSSVTGEGYPEDSASWKTECILVTSENTESANELMESNTAGCISHSEESLLKSGTSKESPVMPNASKNRLPLCKMLSRFSENCRLTVKTSKLNARMLALANFLEENDSAKLQSNGKQDLLHSGDMGVSVFEEYSNNNQTYTACNTGESSTDVIIDSGTKKILLNYLPNPTLSDVRCSCQTAGQVSEPQKTVFEKLHMVESESCALKKSNKWKCKEQEPSEILTVSTKTAVDIMHTKLSKKLFQGKRKTKTLKVTQPVLANANTSVAKKCSSEMINKIREEIGPPLPPLLLPLIATPPKTACTVSPVMSSTGQFSLLSPLDDLISPLCKTPVLPLMSPLTDTPAVKSAILFSPPSPSEMTVGRRILSSPLKFCTSIPKHALPVPGRFPLFAAVSAGPDAPQENSVKILDTMYPELSARARTLNILKGNIQLNRCPFSDSQSLPGPVSQAGGFKAIASTSTAFVKAGSSLKSDSSKDEDKDVQNQQLFSNNFGKRTLLRVSMPRSAKRLRLDSELPRMEPSDITAVRNTKNTISEMQEAFHGKSYEIGDSSQHSSLEESLPVKKDCQKVSLALKKVAESCFDLLPVIKGHVYAGNISQIPVMRDEEREVVYEFGIKNKHLAESLLHVILNKLKAQKNATNYNFSQALCRVYAGICRQLGDLERARLFCYSLLKEDYPDSEKLILFITNVWSDIFVFQGAINKAMQLVVRQSASNEMLACLSAYLNWEQSSSLDAGIMVSNLLLEMQSCTKVEFHLSEQYGEDLSEDAWQYIFAVDLLCSHMKWDWTHDNVISKVLWPSMDNWIKKRKGHETAQSIHDSVIALTLRLIGRLGQIGLKEGYLAAVKNISSVIGLFVQHAKEEAVPWGVQLAAVYSLCDLGTSNPEGIVEAIHAWRAKVPNNIPSAITNGIAEITSLCEMELN